MRAAYLRTKLKRVDATKRFSLIIFCVCIGLRLAAADTLRIALTGDIMMGTTFPEPRLPHDGGRELFRDVAPLLAGADVAAGNLEGTLCDGGQTRKRVSKVCYAFRTPVSYAPLLQAAGYDFLSLANNHAFDFGEEGIRSTTAALSRLSIRYAGLRGRAEIAVTERGGVVYGFCAFGHNAGTCLHADTAAVRRILADLRGRVDILIVSFHGGAEGAASRRLPYGTEYFCNENRGSLREFARFCIDNGADVVFGHGPHVLRAVELYKDRFIAYSLGNFCTPYGISLAGISGYAPVLRLDLLPDGRFAGGRIHSFVQLRGVGPRMDVQHRAAREIRTLTEADVPGTPLRIADDGTLTRR